MACRALAYSFLLLSTFSLAGSARAQTSPRTIRVDTIGHVGTPASLTVTVEGHWRLVDLGDHRSVGEGDGPAEWRFRIAARGRVCAEPEGEIRWLSPPGSRSTGAQRSGSVTEAVALRLEGVDPAERFTVQVARRVLVYPGAVELWPAGPKPGGLRLINEAPIEQYLLGVVTAEGSASFQPEALKALAVAARSYAEHNRCKHQPEADLCDTVHCQVYPGVGRVPEKVARAVTDTAGIVALYEGAVIDAVFSADCGGRTRNSEDVWPGWGKVPYLRSVEDRPPNGGADYCAVYRSHVLHVNLTPAQVAELLGVRELRAGILTLKQVERDRSGRIEALQLSLRAGAESPAPTLPGLKPRSVRNESRRRGLDDRTHEGRFRSVQAEVLTPGSGQENDRDRALDAGDEPLPCELYGAPIRSDSATPAVGENSETRVITLAQLRRSLGPALRGRWVDSFLSPAGALDLEYRGFGHGVGLCQWGAQGMALPPYNHTYEEILRHYYSGISLGAVPTRTGLLSLQFRDEDHRPLAGLALRLQPGGIAGTTDAQGEWQGAVPEGTYCVEARQGEAAMIFYAIRVTAAKGAATRLTLVWRRRDDPLAPTRTAREHR